MGICTFIAVDSIKGGTMKLIEWEVFVEIQKMLEGSNQIRIQLV